MSGGKSLPNCVWMEPEVSRMMHSHRANGFEEGRRSGGLVVDEVPGHAIGVSISVPVATIQQTSAQT